MVNLKLQKRLAASILGCGKRKIWMEPSASADIGAATSRETVRRLIKDGFLVRKPNAIHSRARFNEYLAAKRKGRHTGHGKRKGTREARLSTKTLWIRRLRVLRRMLKRYREANKIDKEVYHELYLSVKGGRYRSKRQVMEVVWRLRAEQQRIQAIQEQARVAKSRADARRKKREERLAQRAEAAAE